MTDRKAWVVFEFGFDYDDSTYHQSEYGNPFEIYETEEDAIKRCDALNPQRLKGIALAYEYGTLDDIAAGDPGEIEEWFKNNKIEHDGDFHVPNTLSHAKLTELYNMINVQFYTYRDIPMPEVKKEVQKSKGITNRFAKIGTEE